ncbi:hypothetical protein GCM10029992_37770 [Glycomyces albus]
MSTAETATAPTRLGTLRRFRYTLAVDYEPDDDGAHLFDLAAIGPGQDDEPLGTVTLTGDGRLQSAWNAAAADIGLVDGSRFETGIHKSLRALVAAIDGAPIPAGHAFRPHPDWEYRLPAAELEAST